LARRSSAIALPVAVTVAAGAVGLEGRRRDRRADRAGVGDGLQRAGLIEDRDRVAGLAGARGADAAGVVDRWSWSSRRPAPGRAHLAVTPEPANDDELETIEPRFTISLAIAPEFRITPVASASYVVAEIWPSLRTPP
jgi:hypothetical protein